VSTCDIDSDIDPEDPPQYHPVGVEQLSPGCKPGECSKDEMSTLKGLNRIIAGQS